MAIDWIESQRNKTSSYAINVDSKAALLAIANKHTTHPLAVVIRVKAIKIRNSTSITFHWVKGHECLKGNERADLAKTVTRYNTVLPSLRLRSLSTEESKYWKTTTQISGIKYM
jgi:ribonuclease HI